MKPAKYRNNEACDQAEHLVAHLHPVPDRLGISMKDQILPVDEPVYDIKEISRDERDFSLDEAISQFAGAIEEKIDRNDASDDFIKEKLHANICSSTTGSKTRPGYASIGRVTGVIAIATWCGRIRCWFNCRTDRAFDRALGLDFRAYLNFVNERLAITYASIRWQLLAIAIVLPLIGYYRRPAEFMFCFGITLIAATAISTLMPATGVYGALGLKPEDFQNLEPTCYYDTLRELPLVRDGTTRLLDAFHLGPILTFPS